MIKLFGDIDLKRYKSVEISEKQLEERVRKVPDSIEEGLRYIDHQKGLSVDL